MNTVLRSVSEQRPVFRKSEDSIMSKAAGDLTVAIRGLLDADGDLTHLTARPLLKKLGFPIVPKPGRGLAAELKQWKEYGVDYDDPSSIEDTIAECGFDEETGKAVVAKALFVAEANNFNVVKNIWTKLQASGASTPSRKPKAKAKNQRATAAASQPKPARPRGDKKKKAAPTLLKTGAEIEALVFVEENGGMAAVEKSLTEARATVSELEQVIDEVAALTKRISAAA